MRRPRFLLLLLTLPLVAGAAPPRPRNAVLRGSVAGGIAVTCIPGPEGIAALVAPLDRGHLSRRVQVDGHDRLQVRCQLAYGALWVTTYFASADPVRYEAVRSTEHFHRYE